MRSLQNSDQERSAGLLGVAFLEHGQRERSEKRGSRPVSFSGAEQTANNI